MARLTIEQVAAPNFSASAQLLAGAGQSFNQGLSAASSLLDKYATGQQAKGDAALTQALIGVQDEAGIADFLANNDLSNMNLSPEMLAAARGLRDSTIGYAQGRANVDQTRANTALTGANTNRVNVGTSLAQAAESRTAADWAYGNTRRDEIAGIASQYAGALAEGQQFGNTGAAQGATQDTRLMLARTLQMEGGNQGVAGMIDIGSVIRNRAASGRYGEGIEGVIMRPGQFSAWNGVTGYANGEQGQNTEFTPSAEAFAAADAILSGEYQDRTGGATHYYAELPDSPAPSWTNSSFRKTDGDHFFGNADGVGAVNGNTGAYPTTPAGPVNSNRGLSPAAAALMQAVAQNTTMTIEDVDALFSGINGATDRGQGQIDAAEATRVGNVQAQAALDALNGDSITPGAAVSAGAAAGETAGLTPSQILAGMGTTRDVATTNADILAPSVATDPLLAAQAESDARTRGREIDALPQTRLLATAERYGDDAVGGLVADLGLGADGEDAQSYVFGLFGEDADNNTLRQHINTIAEQAGVTPSMAAAAMADEFARDPWGINRNSKRFDPADVVAHLNATVGPEGMQAYEGALVQQQTDDARTQAAQLQLGALQTQLAKTQDPVRRTQLQSQISELTTSIRTSDVQGPAPTVDAQLQRFLQTSEEDFARQLQRATPGSDEHNQILNNMVQAIEQSPNMSRSQKTLLIERIRG